MSFDERKVVEEILADTASFYHQSLTEEARTYLIEERRFTTETIERFKIGYANGGLRENLVNRLQYPEELCLKSGVLKKEDNGVRDFFDKRIIFPNLKQDRVVHLTGREFGSGGVKYLHLPGQIRYLFNEDALVGPDVYIVEGPTDCIAAAQLSFPSVAILGASNLKPTFVSKFSRCKRIYLCLDSDQAGEICVSKIGALFPDRAFVVQLPSGMDPGDYFKSHGKEDFLGIVESARKFLDFLLDLVPRDTDKIELPSKLNFLLTILAHVDTALAEHFLVDRIEPRFELRSQEVDAYRKSITQRRRSEKETLKKRTLSEDKDINFIAKFDGLIDLVGNNGAITFLVKTGNDIEVKPHVDLDNARYFPPPKTQIPWLLPRMERVVAAYQACQTDSATFGRTIYNEIRHYLYEIAELPGETYYDLLVAWCIHTYLLEGTQYSPIICLHAVPERGKSRMGKALIHLSFRGVHLESLREAFIVRVAQHFGASLFFDVRDIWKKAENNGSEDILLHRFEKGATVPRVVYPERGPLKDTVYFSIFGPTIIATNLPLDKILETRAIFIHMPEAYRRFENDVVSETALELKEKLVAFRAWQLGRPLPKTQKPTSGRLGDILKPLLQIILLVNPEKEEEIRMLFRELKEERLLEKSMSLEAEILNVISALSYLIRHGSLPIKEIADRLNVERSEAAKLTYQRIGRILSSMGFRKVRTDNGASAILYDYQQIIQMLEAYGLEGTSETPETSEKSGFQETPQEEI